MHHAETSSRHSKLSQAPGQAIVTLSGRGPHGTKASRIEYDRHVGEWLAAGRQSVVGDTESVITVNELLLRYWRFAEHYYRKNGMPTNELGNIRYALRPVRELYGRTPAEDFGPLALKSIQQRFISDGICRGQINQRIGRIKRVIGVNDLPCQIVQRAITHTKNLAKLCLLEAKNKVTYDGMANILPGCVLTRSFPTPRMVSHRRFPSLPARR